MFNEMIVASVNPFTQGKPDKNGKNPIILNIVAGKSPNRTVLSGTVAESVGLIVGKTFLMTVREVEPSDEYGRQFNHQVLSELKGLEIVQTAKEIGAAVLIPVDGPGVDPNQGAKPEGIQKPEGVLVEDEI